MIREDTRILVPASIHEDIKRFILQMRETEMTLSDIGITRSKDSILDIYASIFITCI